MIYMPTTRRRKHTRYMKNELKKNGDAAKLLRTTKFYFDREKSLDNRH